MIGTPKALRTHIGIFGRRNSGKSSLLNALAGQDVSLVSEVAGTTTDPVEKSMEFHDLGPVLFIDTAGVDDEGELGEARVERTRRILQRIDVAVLVTEPGHWDKFEIEILDLLAAREVPVVVALNKKDLKGPNPQAISELEQRNIRWLPTSALTGGGVGCLRRSIAELAKTSRYQERPLLSDLVAPGSLVLMVAPVDPEAPKGRIKMLQVHAIRELLDGNSASLVVKDTDLPQALLKLSAPPDLVVSDSQCLDAVAALLPPDVPLTSFSILMARYKGDLALQLAGTEAASALKPGDRVLVAEACTHHPLDDDIGRVKIPRWLNEKVGGELVFEHYNGHDFPADLSDYKLVIHCGGCMLGRGEMVSRLDICRRQHIPVTNYGLLIAECLGLLERTTEMFAESLMSAQTASV